MLAVKTPAQFFRLNSKSIPQQQYGGDFLRIHSCEGKSYFIGLRTKIALPARKSGAKYFVPVQVVSSGGQVTETSSTQCEDFTIATSGTSNDNELRISVKVSGTKTQAIFDEVFSKMVSDAQPIPGFRRVKGGKTPNIPNDILLEILGPSKVYKQVINKVINSTISKYVEKEGLKVSKDLRIEQSFEDLEAEFEPAAEFQFSAIAQRQD